MPCSAYTTDEQVIAQLWLPPLFSRVFHTHTEDTDGKTEINFDRLWLLLADEVVCVSTETLAKKTVVLGITGSIAAVRTIELAHELIRRGVTFTVLLGEG